MIAWARVGDLNDIIAILPAANDLFMYLEQIPAVWLDEAERQSGIHLETFDPAVDFNLWARGRVFCQLFELRWEQLDGQFHAVYCGQPAALPGLQSSDDLNLSTCHTSSIGYFLWGEAVGNEQLTLLGLPADTQVFVELRVPRLFYYPVSSTAQRVKLRVCEYRDPAGNLVYYRFQGLEEVP